MREFTTPAAPARPDLTHVTDLLAERLRVAADHVAFTTPSRTVTTAQFHDDCRSLARGLVSAGLEPGGLVAVLAPTRYEWTVVDFAIWLAGGIVVPIYETAAEAQIREAVVGVAFAFGGDEDARAMLVAAAVESVWTMDPGDDDLDALRRLGETTPDGEIDRRRRLAGPADVATLVYTSGTTGSARAVPITHGNLVGEVVNVAHAYREIIHDRASTVVVLPLSHILARGLQTLAIWTGMRVRHESDPTKLVGLLAEVKPTFLVVVPRVLQKVHDAIAAKAQSKHLGGLFRAARATAIAWAADVERGRRPRLAVRARRRLFDWVFFRRIRAVLGGRMETMLSGAAALDRDLSLFFRGAGIPVIEGYGLTETTAPATGNLPGRIRSGTVGVPVPGTTIRIADDGEVLVKGPGVFEGYLAADNDEFWVDGFFRTGDLGSLDADGYLTITGRAKDIIVTAAGKNVSPAPWENALLTHPFVGQAVMVGEGRPYLAAVIVLDYDVLRARGEVLPAPTDGLTVVDNPVLRQQVQEAVDAANSVVSRAEQVRRFVLVTGDVTATLTPTLKVKRDAFRALTTDLVDEMYAAGKDMT